MIITPDQALALLSGATPGPWKWRKHSPRSSDRDFDSLGPSAECRALETQDAEDYASWVVADDEDKALIAAAPDLAQTVIEQGKRIAELEAQNAALRSTDTSEWGY